MKLHIAFAFILTGCLLHSAANAQIIKPTQIQIPDGPMCPSRVLDVDARRSLFVTELDVVQNALSLHDVLSALARDSGIPGLHPIDLWDQWWDTQNPGPGLGRGPHCDDHTNSNGQASLNGFPIDCPRSEGSEIRVDPFDPREPSFYEPIALVNRFDLMPEDGAHCGEYRAIFARSSGAENDRLRNLLIFEAVLPNPNPGCGQEGCRQVAEFWADLSHVRSPARRAEMLREFYLRGIPTADVEPVIRVAHFSPGAGQIRTNQFLNAPDPVQWQLRDYKLALGCAETDTDCSLQFVPVTVKTNPFGELFGDAEFDPNSRTSQFQRHFLTQVDKLAATDIHSFFNAIPDRFNAGQSTSEGTENDYEFHFNAGGDFARAIRQRLQRIESPLSPTQIVRRSLTQSCAGCHELSNFSPRNRLGEGISWPSSLGFVHVTEQVTETLNGSEHFLVSPAIKTTFLPHRESVFEDFLAARPCLRCTGPSMERTSGATPISVQLDAENSNPFFDPDAVMALDRELKEGQSMRTLGGPRPVH